MEDFAAGYVDLDGFLEDSTVDDELKSFASSSKIIHTHHDVLKHPQTYTKHQKLSINFYEFHRFKC